MKTYRLTFHLSKKKRNSNAKYKWARVYWKFLYTLSKYYPKEPSHREKIGYEQFIYTFINVIPCEECRRHYYEYVIRNPPTLHSRHSLRAWVRKLHKSM